MTDLARGRRSPFLVLAGVLAAITVVTAGLVVANGDDFAKARIPPRPRLPVVSTGAIPVENLPEPTRVRPREVRVEGSLPPVPVVGDGHRLVPFERRRVERLARALGVRAELLTFGGIHTAVDGDRRFTAGSGDGVTAFALESGALADCADDPSSCPVSSGADPSSGPQPSLVSPSTRGATSTTRPARPIDEAAASRIVLDVVGVLALDRPTITRTAAEGGHWVFRVAASFAGAAVPGWEVWIRVSSTGVVTEARGWMGQPEKAGTYALVTVDVGLERLRTGWPVGEEQPSPAPDAEGLPPGCVRRRGGIRCVDAVPPVEMTVDAGGAVEPIPADEEPTPPTPPPAVTVRSVRLGHQLIDDGSGTWLVPAFVFRTSDGEELAVPAIVDAEVRRTFRL